jgi:hypothetical protein
MLYCIVAVWILDDLVDVGAEVLKDGFSLFIIVLESAHKILQDAEPILMIHDSYELLHGFVENIG